MTEQEYFEAVTTKGYEPPVRKSWEAGTSNPSHAHEKSLFLFIEKGQIRFELEDAKGQHVTTCQKGDVIEVPGGINHSELVGPEGAEFLVASK